MSRRRKILIVDDDPTVLRLLTRWLQKADFDVQRAGDGEEAMRMAREDCPHFLITDWEMPRMSGVELCRQIRQAGLPHYVYTVLITSRTSDSDLLEGVEAGADDLLTKPLVPIELMARLRAGTRVIELENKLLHLAQTDPLTGVPNRWVFFEQIQHEMEQAVRRGIPLCCALVDIDFFKSINDTYGHQAGDLMLKEVAAAISGECRPVDYLCRYGGEEFCVLLTDTDEQGGQAWSERIRSTLSRLTVTMDGARMAVTASFGVAERTADVQTADELVNRADAALRIAKQSGRDRVIRYSEFSGDAAASIRSDSGYRESFRDALARDITDGPAISLRPEQTLAEAADLFLRERIEAAPVINVEGRLLGLITEKELITEKPHSKGWSERVGELMVAHAVSFDEVTPAVVLYDFLCRVAVPAIVVVCDARPVGLVTRNSLLKWLNRRPDGVIPLVADPDPLSIQLERDRQAARCLPATG